MTSIWSDLSRRAVTFVVAVPAVAAIAAWGSPLSWAALVGAALMTAARECITLLTRGGRPWAAWIGAFATLAVSATLYLASGSSPGSMTLWLLVAFGGAAIVFSSLRSRLRDPGRRATATAIAAILFTVVYCGLLPAHLALLRRDAGSPWVLFALAVAWGGDVAGYLAGRALGGPRLAPGISPGKTVAGAIAGLAAAAAIGAAFARLGPLTTDRVWILPVAVGAGLLSQVGDLGESFLKRRCDAKDSGVLVWGHGGVLDCIDGLILMAPWLYYAHGHLR